MAQQRVRRSAAATHEPPAPPAVDRRRTALVVAIAATTMAVVQQRRAERQRQDAELDLLNGSAIEAADTNFALSGLLGAEALRLRPDGESRIALQRSLRAQPSALRSIYPSYVTSDTGVAGQSPDGRTVALRSPQGLTFVDTTTLDASGTFDIADPLAGEFSPDGTKFAIATAEAITILDVGTFATIAEFPVAFPGGHPASDLTWSDDSHLWIASEGVIEPFLILDADSGELRRARGCSDAGPYLIEADAGLGLAGGCPAHRDRRLWQRAGSDRRSDVLRAHPRRQDRRDGRRRVPCCIVGGAFRLAGRLTVVFSSARSRT